MGDPSGRMLHLLSLLQTHRFWPGPELCSRLEVSPRTLRRDIDRLRELGYLIDATRGIDGGYRLEAGADLPPLLLEDEEAVAIAVGLRTAANGPVAGIEEAAVRALAKLEQVLPSRLRRRVDDLGRAWVPLVTAPATVDWTVLSLIAQACRDEVRLRFEYVARDATRTTREVEPNRLVSVGRRWYLVAWDRDRADWRTFRVDRLHSAPEVLTRFNPRSLPGGDAAEFVAAALDSVWSKVEVSTTVHATADQIDDWAGWFGATVEPIGPERCRVSLTGETIEWLAACLGMLGHDFEVHEPPELTHYLGELASRLERAASVAGHPASVEPEGHPGG